VRSSLLHVFTIISLLSLSYRHSPHSTLTAIKSKIKVHNIWVKHWDTTQWDHHSFVFLPSSYSCLFHTDTHYTPTWQQSNRRSRCPIFGWSIETQHSEIITPSCFYHHLIPVSFIQTLTTLQLDGNQIGAQGAQYLGEALRHNTVRSSLLHVFTIISFLYLSYRHSLHSNLTAVKSEIKVPNIWVKHWDTTQWDHHSFVFLPSSYSCLFHTDTHYTPTWRQSNRSSRCAIFGRSIATQYSEIITPSCFYHHLIPVSFIQTLTTLQLDSSQIGDQGAQYLGEALRHNTVRSSLLRVFTIISFLSLSYRHSLNSTCRSTELEIKVPNIWMKHYDTIQWDHHSFVFLPSSHSCLFHTDTHYTPTWRQSNRSSRCTIFGWSIETQYSEIINPSCFYHYLIPISFIQTLTTLNLSGNQIGAQGAQYLGEALRHNTVRSSLLHVFTIISLLSLSYRHSPHSTLTAIKSEIKVHNIWVKHYDTIQWDHHSFVFLPSSHSCLFHTDTHHTRP